MASSDHSPETMKHLGGSSKEQPRNTEPSAAAGKNGRKPSTSKTPKNKVPQRGMGVERLEQMRVQESLQQAVASGLVVLPPPPPQPQTPPPTPLYHQQPHHPHHHQNIPFVYGAPSPHHVAYGAYGLDQYPKPLIYGGNNNNNTFGVLDHPHQGPNFTTVGATAPGWSGPNYQHHQLNRVVGPFGSGTPFGGGSPMEASKELSSIPNLHSASGSQSFAFGHKENVFYQDNARGSNVRRDMPGSDPWIKVAGDGGYYREKPAELIAVHQNGSSEVVMEYEFFPGKYGRGTGPKVLEFPTIGSGSAGGGASNSIDLSLKL